jgi:hypothetical protein
VKRFWKSPNHDLERELRKHRPEPRSEFLASLSADISRQRGRRLGRVALAGALSVAMLTIFAGLGGMGYAAAAAKQAISSSSNNSSNSSQNNNSVNSSQNTSNNPANDQYKPGKGCGDQNHVHERENECKKLK